MDLKNNECALNEEVLVFGEHCRSISSAAGAGRAIDVGDFVHYLACLGREIVEVLAEAYRSITFVGSMRLM